MNHELPAPDYGFIWPHLTFASDGEAMGVNCRPSPSSSNEPVRYLSEFNAFLPALEFERETDNFMDLVLRRLDNLGATELHVLWGEVLAERADPTQSAARRFEALLGYEPDDAPVSLVERLLELAELQGSAVADEIAPVCAGSDPAGALNQIIDLASRAGVPGRIAISNRSGFEARNLPPWERGRELAKEVRKTLGLSTEPMDDATLAEILQIHSATLVNPAKSWSPASIGLAIRSGREDLKFLFRKRYRPARRFEAARFIADHLCAEPRDRWLPTSDSSTARQKVQRAFSAEFLCPIAALRDYLGDEFLPEAFEDAAEHFVFPRWRLTAILPITS